MKLICMTIATLVAISFLVTPCNSFNPLQQYIERGNSTQFGQIQQYIERGDNYTPAPGCPGTEGYYYQRSSRQCFKLITRPNVISWSEARQVCHQDPDKLVMAHPTDPIGLRSHLVSEYASGPNSNLQVEPWLNCKYEEDLQAYVWQDDFTILPRGSPLWFPGHHKVFDGGCLLLFASEGKEIEAPAKPYFSQNCNTGYYHVLCESIKNTANFAITDYIQPSFVINLITTRPPVIAMPVPLPIQDFATTSGCPGIQGFYYHRSSRQCFKLIKRPNAISWAEARQVCHQDPDKLVMAHPTDPIGLRSHLVSEYGSGGGNSNLQVEPWLNCKYEEDLQEYVWQDDFTILPRGSPLWFPGHHKVFDGGCLLLFASEEKEIEAPTKPYFSQNCTTGYYHVLCEKLVTNKDISRYQPSFVINPSSPGQNKFQFIPWSILITTRPPVIAMPVPLPIQDFATTSGCPGTQGFYYQRSSRQCFKLIKRPNAISWAEARQVCHQDPDKLVMAHPTDPIGLRNHLVSEYAPDGGPHPDLQVEPWLNCKYEDDLQEYVWQDDFTILPRGSPLWFPGHHKVFDGGCLLLLAWEKWENEAPTKPYFSQHCTTGYYHVLCEKILSPPSY